MALGLLLIALPAGAQAPEPLVLVQTIALPDVRGRIDHLDIDLAGERLFVAALGNDTVEVIDLRSGRRSARLDHLQEPQGVAYLANEMKLVVANGRSGRLDMFAGPALEAAGHIDGLEDADNVRFEAATAKLYVGYGNDLAVIEATNGKFASRIKLEGHPESFQLETAGSRMFINVPSAGHIAVVDRRKGVVLTTWLLGDAKANFPMALDEPGHRLFVATRRPAMLLVYDTETGKRVASMPVGADADDLFFDSERKQVYAICGQGVIDVIQQQDADHYRGVGRLTTAPGARTGLFVAARKLLYVAAPAQRSASAQIRVYSVE